MKAVGIIAEYNPFHNGHLYHLNKVKEMFPDAVIVLVLSGHFMQRGEVSIINKWDKTEIALASGIDLVIELPFPFASQSADIFAKGSIQILKALNVDTLVFGSETNDIEKLKSLALLQFENKDYHIRVKQYLKAGLSYPASLDKANIDSLNHSTDTPNDILGIAYIKAIIAEKANINPISIKRTNDYHENTVNKSITSATSIRNYLRNNVDIKESIPKQTTKYLKDHLFYIEDYFPYLKYQIMNNINYLNKFQTVDEGIENRIKKYIITSSNLDDLINNIKTKRYTYNKIRRMLTHIMCNFTKVEALTFKNIEYLRVLGFSPKGRSYLNKIKKKLSLPLVTNFIDNKMLGLELRTTSIYASILNEEDKIKLIMREYAGKPIKNTSKK